MAKPKTRKNTNKNKRKPWRRRIAKAGFVEKKGKLKNFENLKM